MMFFSSKFYIFFFFYLFVSLLFASLSSSSSSSAAAATTTSAWDSFLDLSGCHIGDNNPVLPLLKSYLRRFGYLPQPSGSSTSEDDDDTFDSDLESAIKTYQQNFHLDPTGLLDLPTISQLISPRCGVADIVNGTLASSSTSGRHLYTYFPYNPTWPPNKRSLTYAFTSTSATSIPASALRPVFSRAFARWSIATELTFSEVSSDDNPDVTIEFYRGDHGDGEPFDGPGGMLAHAFSPTDGRFHLDADESWVAEGDVGEEGVDMESVAVHEIGHLLGLGHSSEKEAIMYPTLRMGMRKVELTKDDVEGVQSLYGSNPSYKVGAGSLERDGNSGGGGLMVRGWVFMLTIYLIILLVL